MNRAVIADLDTYLFISTHQSKSKRKPNRNLFSIQSNVMKA
jgi:hypothetical protein